MFFSAVNDPALCWWYVDDSHGWIKLGVCYFCLQYFFHLGAKLIAGTGRRKNETFCLNFEMPVSIMDKSQIYSVKPIFHKIRPILSLLFLAWSQMELGCLFWCWRRKERQNCFFMPWRIWQCRCDRKGSFYYVILLSFLVVLPISAFFIWKAGISPWCSCVPGERNGFLYHSHITTGELLQQCLRWGEVEVFFSHSRSKTRKGVQAACILAAAPHLVWAAVWAVPLSSYHRPPVINDCM